MKYHMNHQEYLELDSRARDIIRVCKSETPLNDCKIYQLVLLSGKLECIRSLIENHYNHRYNEGRSLSSLKSLLKRYVEEFEAMEGDIITRVKTEHV